ncbi:DUF58 domain-containing protein [Rhodothermus profundi]|uniref:VWFA domain-containing protein n=1 Tax=Rhodothermus profundi TaxID=633813 RepID=A0A1M6VDH0_9BACT|nr:DUF58 domain-containing protein [Rhodothermus profundi]SHK79414.1 Protein of unknown function DUF58 [Rhodothermus profundi]
MARPAILQFLDPAVLSRLKNMELRARLIVEGFITGLHRSPYHGFSVEFAEHRPYNPGDELRHIDWKVYGKTDRFYVKQYEEETNLRHYIVLDTSPSMRYRYRAPLSKLEYSAYLAAALHFLMLRQQDATGLIAFDERVHTLLPPKSKPGYLHTLLAHLEQLVHQKPAEMRRTAVASVLHEVAERIHRRSLVVLITDLFDNRSAHDELLRALRHLRHRGHEVLVFHVLEGDAERRFALPDRPLRLFDVETGEELTLHPAQFREAYVRALQTFTEQFRRRCLEHRIDFIELDTGQPYDVALLAYLNKRQRLG